MRYVYYLGHDDQKVVNQLYRLNANRLVLQPNSIEVTEAEYLNVNANMMDTEFYFDSKDALKSRPRNVPYQELRRRDYPETSEQLDALWKAVDALSKGTPIPPDAQTVLNDIQDVKTRFPKRNG